MGEVNKKRGTFCSLATLINAAGFKAFADGGPEMPADESRKQAFFVCSIPKKENESPFEILGSQPLFLLWC